MWISEAGHLWESELGPQAENYPHLTLELVAAILAGKLSEKVVTDFASSSCIVR